MTMMMTTPPAPSGRPNELHPLALGEEAGRWVALGGGPARVLEAAALAMEQVAGGTGQSPGVGPVGPAADRHPDGQRRGVPGGQGGQGQGPQVGQSTALLPCTSTLTCTCSCTKPGG